MRLLLFIPPSHGSKNSTPIDCTWTGGPCPVKYTSVPNIPRPKTQSSSHKRTSSSRSSRHCRINVIQKKKERKKTRSSVNLGSCLVACQSSFGTAAFMKNGRRHRMGSEDKLTVSGPSTYIHSITEAVHAHWINLPRLYLSSIFQTFPNA